MSQLLDIYRRAKHGPWKVAGYDVQYRIEETPEAIYLIFQYTASDSDWLFNFAWPPRPYKDQPVPWRAHWGFATLYKSARDEIMADIKATGISSMPGGFSGIVDAVVFNQKSLIVVGISQGAALATLAHEDLHFNGILATTYAFASPRVLWMPKKEIQTRFNRLMVINRRGDIVTMLPPWLLGFRHVGKIKRIGRPACPWWTHHTFEAYEQALSIVDA